ncbi:3-isopropylmalate dehydratase large subunit [Arthrospiribacter ruber]|uniref:3-isopropylmalate dehydratase large subunit n=1 Tax=Arthrospiribacter ruber TaxID=2487934 RepID=A0A951MFU3_9BACT|nr:3-isopropylmalate dehydratase large subunit [Arthrospiribacter ruber]MBW3470097.1 3-isopropylmalate dehydratase large subunit [Arthrospiribacter ruber]
MEKKTLFDKIWDAHVVKSVPAGPDVFFIDKHFIHEVTSPVAFLNLEKRGVSVLYPERTVATPDHNVPTVDQDKTIKDKLSRMQVEKLRENCKKYDIELHDLGTDHHGIVHVIGPELGITQPGMTIVCGDSHTSTHGAFGAIAFGIGTSEVEMVLATQCIMQSKPKKMRITVDGELGQGVTSKDIILYIISKITAAGATGYFVEYAGSAFRNLSMEARMTVCNMSIEMGARGGLIAPDQTTFDYLKGKRYAPKGEAWDRAVAEWTALQTDEGAVFEKEYNFDAADIEPMITYGTNPGMGIKIKDLIPTDEGLEGSNKKSFLKSLDYMGFAPGEAIKGKVVDYVFVGSCTNGRIEDIRAVANFVKGKKKADNITAWIVPGSREVEKLASEEGLVQILEEAGFQLRQPGCSACLAMNDDKIPSGKYAVSTSNRNFEGRQGPGARTLLASPLTVAAVAVTGKITDPREV